MADKSPIIEHSGFKSALDPDYINIGPKGSIQYCEDSKNLTPFDKIGSMSQTRGHEIYTDYAQMPHVSGYKPIDVFYYSLDKDSKEITILVYKSTSTEQIKIYINPYFNPDNTYSNHNPNKSSDSWIAEWIELTETYQAQLNGAASTTTFSVDTDTPTLPATNDYFNGWFAVNTSIGFNGSRFNFITDYVHSTKTFTTKTNTGWGDNHVIQFYRFPVVYLHRIQAPTPLSSHQYSVPASNIFLGKPTEFRAKENQLRIACGKNYRPLILDFIYQRKYLKGNSDMSYYGFWFDFSQIPQVQDKSAITGFASLTTGSTSVAYIDAATGKFTNSAPSNGISITSFTGVINLGISHTLVPGSTEDERLKLIVPNNIAIFDNKDILLNYLSPSTFLSISLDNAVEALNSAECPLSQFLTFAKIGTGNLTTTSASFPLYYEQRAIQSVTGVEAGGNTLASNYFLGTEVSVTDAGSGVITSAISRNIMIATCTYDNRNEILIGHGTYRPSSEGTVTTDDDYGFEVRFTTWFSRRLTQLNLYTKNINNRNLQTSTTINSVVQQMTTYPYYAWEIKHNLGADDYIKINELPLFNSYDIYEFDKTKNGERVENIRAAVNTSSGINAYTLDTSNYNWYIKFKDDYNGVKSTGKRVRFIVNTNRYIDQDTTMNYTKSVFNGQTNGRYFLINCKNEIEKELFDNDDLVLPNNYAYGVSQYDIYLRDRNLPVSQGDKDINRTIHNLSGRLLICKESNTYMLEVNTDNDIKYRVIDTNSGRGTTFIDGISETPYGILIPTKEAIWLYTGQSFVPILSKDNSKLKLYRDLINNQEATVIGSVYSNDKNEAYFFIQYTEDSSVITYQFIYSFVEKHWTYNYFDGNIETGDIGIVPIKIRATANKEIVFLNYYNSTNFNIVKINGDSNKFIKADGTSKIIFWNYETLFTAYNGLANDINLEKIWLNVDLYTQNSAKIKVTVFLDSIDDSYNIEADVDNIANMKNKIITLLPQFTRNPTYLKFKIYNTDEFEIFALNALLAKENLEPKKFTNNEINA